jgi:dTDP-4-dehydrorhamnose 3,5-epimerase
MDPIIQSELTSKIPGVRIFKLKQIHDERGAVLHMLRSDAEHFDRFGEIYFSEVIPGKVKAWKKHRLMTQNFAVPVGQIRLVIIDDDIHSPSKYVYEELILGRPDNYHLVRIPPLLWYGFQGLAETPSLLVNCSDLCHDPNESEIRDLSDPNFPNPWD